MCLGVQEQALGGQLNPEITGKLWEHALRSGHCALQRADGAHPVIKDI